MTVLTATELKNHLGLHIDRAHREPIVIRKSGRDCAVMIGPEAYERFMALEDRYWSEKAAAAHAGGYLTADETADSIRRRLDALAAEPE